MDRPSCLGSTYGFVTLIFFCWRVLCVNELCQQNLLTLCISPSLPKLCIGLALSQLCIPSILVQTRFINTASPQLVINSFPRLCIAYILVQTMYTLHPCSKYGSNHVQIRCLKPKFIPSMSHQPHSNYVYSLPSSPQPCISCLSI